jgi:hypothetical protein
VSQIQWSSIVVFKGVVRGATAKEQFEIPAWFSWPVPPPMALELLRRSRRWVTMVVLAVLAGAAFMFYGRLIGRADQFRPPGSLGWTAGGEPRQAYPPGGLRGAEPLPQAVGGAWGAEGDSSGPRSSGMTSSMEMSGFMGSVGMRMRHRPWSRG